MEVFVEILENVRGEESSELLLNDMSIRYELDDSSGASVAGDISGGAQCQHVPPG